MRWAALGITEPSRCLVSAKAANYRSRDLRPAVGDAEKADPLCALQGVPLSRSAGGLLIVYFLTDLADVGSRCRQQITTMAAIDAAAYEATPMPHYRVHILDRRGDLISAVELDCSDDEAAKARVREVLDGRGAKLWRLVTMFEPNSPSVQPSHEELLARGRPRTRGHKRRAKSR